MIPIEHLYILLGQMLLSPAIAKDASERIQPSYFVHPEITTAGAVQSTAAHGIIFSAIRGFYLKTGALPDPATVRSEARILLSIHQSETTLTVEELEITIGVMYLFHQGMTDASAHTARAIIDQMYKTCCVDPERKKIVAEAQSIEQIESLGNKLIELQSKLKPAASDFGLTNIYSEDTETADGIRFLTGIDFIDKACGNGRDMGPTSGCSAAIIAGQGSGKTTLGTEMTIKQCLMGKDAMLVMTEIGFTTMVKRKHIACATGIPYAILEQTKGDLKEASRITGMDYEKAMKAFTLLQKHMIGVDFTKTIGGLEEIETILSNNVTAGRTPSVVYIDWAGPLASHMMATKTGGRYYKDPREALEAIGEFSARISKRYNTFVCVAHQMASKNVDKGPFGDNSYTCAHECKTFTASMSYCFVINPPCKETGLQLFHIPKRRNDEPKPPTIVRLRGDIARFEEVTGFMRQGKRFKPSAPKVDGNMLPREKQKRQSSETEG